MAEGLPPTPQFPSREARGRAHCGVPPSPWSPRPLPENPRRSCRDPRRSRCRRVSVQQRARPQSQGSEGWALSVQEPFFLSSCQRRESSRYHGSSRLTLAAHPRRSPCARESYLGHGAHGRPPVQRPLVLLDARAHVDLHPDPCSDWGGGGGTKADGNRRRPTQTATSMSRTRPERIAATTPRAARERESNREERETVRPTSRRLKSSCPPFPPSPLPLAQT